jgi:predicted nucleic acid-binding protein
MGSAIAITIESFTALSMIFVDTGAWYALSVPADLDHQAAVEFIRNNEEPLATSDYVVDELLTLCATRKRKHVGVQWLRDVLESGPSPSSLLN